MIISVSRRTDIPAFYSDWFFNRIKEGWALTRNPFNGRVSKISLLQKDVDGIVFWTKNPLPMLDRLDALEEYLYYFQFTLTAYGRDIEQSLPDKDDVLIPAFIKLSDKIGCERVIWRYDPILLTEAYTIQYHAEHFRQIAAKLQGYTKKCIMSFVDAYKNTRSLNLKEITAEDMKTLAKALSQTAKEHGMTLTACSEAADLSEFGVLPASCVDTELFESLSSSKLNIAKDKNQRQNCNCSKSVDLGAYNTCLNGCKYCYANYNKSTVEQNYKSHDAHSPLLVCKSSDV